MRLAAVSVPGSSDSWTRRRVTVVASRFETKRVQIKDADFKGLFKNLNTLLRRLIAGVAGSMGAIAREAFRIYSASQPVDFHVTILLPPAKISCPAYFQSMKHCSVILAGIQHRQSPATPPQGHCERLGTTIGNANPIRIQSSRSVERLYFPQLFIESDVTQSHPRGGRNTIKLVQLREGYCFPWRFESSPGHCGFKPVSHDAGFFLR
jgi:hypothetical protein